MRDNFRIKEELLALFTIACVTATAMIVKMVFDLPHFDDYLVFAIDTFLTFTILIPLPIFLALQRQSIPTMCLLRSDFRTFQLMLTSPVYYKQFKEVVVKEFMVPFLLFHEDYKMWSFNPSSVSPIVTKNLFDDFVDLNAAFSLNVPHEIRRKIKADLNSRDLLISDFEEVDAYVLQKLYDNCYYR